MNTTNSLQNEHNNNYVVVNVCQLETTQSGTPHTSGRFTLSTYPQSYPQKERKNKMKYRGIKRLTEPKYKYSVEETSTDRREYEIITDKKLNRDEVIEIISSASLGNHNTMVGVELKDDKAYVTHTDTIYGDDSHQVIFLYSGGTFKEVLDDE